MAVPTITCPQCSFFGNDNDFKSVRDYDLCDKECKCPKCGNSFTVSMVVTVLD